ncbi:MAG: hypothetical protein Q9183_004229 [Haloplaca sp. 2 TL-2023]
MIDMSRPEIDNTNLGAASSEQENSAFTGPVTKTEDDQLEAEVRSPVPPQMQSRLQEQTIDLTNDDVPELPVAHEEPSSVPQQTRIESEDLDEMERETRQVLIDLHQQKLKDILERKARLSKGDPVVKSENIDLHEQKLKDILERKERLSVQGQVVKKEE